jgi:hypothetical protein
VVLEREGEALAAASNELPTAKARREKGEEEAVLRSAAQSSTELQRIAQARGRKVRGNKSFMLRAKFRWGPHHHAELLFL